METEETRRERPEVVAARPGERPMVMAVVVTYGNAPVTMRCVESLLDSGYPNLKMLLVDCASPDGAGEALRREFPSADYPDIAHLQLNQNLGYAGGNMAGMERALDEDAFAVLVINNDCVVAPGFLDPLVDELLAHPRTGLAGPLQLSHDDDGNLIWANAGSRFDLTREVIYPDGPSGTEIPPPTGRFSVGFVCGACALFRSEALRDVGLYDPRLFLGSEEPDWSIRAKRRGWESVTIPASKITHDESASTSKIPEALAYLHTRNRLWVIRRHGTRIQVVIAVVRTLFWRMPKAAMSRLLAGEFGVAYAGILGSLAGLMESCYRGVRPDEAAEMHLFELATPREA